MTQRSHPRFGTDGVRGRAGTELTAHFVLDLGVVATRAFVEASGRIPTVVVGEDTRASSASLRSALAAGMSAAGGDVVECGVIPTAGVALVTRELGADAGAVVSASHNPASDNGVKFFAAGGQKLPDELESKIQAELDAVVESGGADVCDPARMGSVRQDTDLSETYVRVLLASLGESLAGIRAIVDCANGAASLLGPRVLREAGVTVEAIFDQPDGLNINAGCGATQPGELARRVRVSRADIGLAFDGDADRLVAVDAQGHVVDGDDILAVCAVDLHARGRLTGDGVVATVMSNLGLRRYLSSRGISVEMSPVGDRNVLLSLESNGLSLGGEQSGHLIFRDLAPTGDGLLTALMLCSVLKRSGRPLSELTAEIEKVPQRLVNVALADQGVLDDADELWDVVASVESDLGERGQVVVRASGTEPKLRIMVQADTSDVVDASIDRISAAASRLR